MVSQKQVFQLSELQACCEDQSGWTRHTISSGNFSNSSGEALHFHLTFYKIAHFVCLHRLHVHEIKNLGSDCILFKIKLF